MQNFRDQITTAIKEKADTEKAAMLQRYFKTGAGGYGEGDVFVGVKVPEQRKIAACFYKEATPEDLVFLLNNIVHEYRLVALFIMVLQFQKSKSDAEKEAIVNLYLQNLSGVNNWDLVDSSAPYLLGAFLYDKPKTLLFDLAASGSLWQQRIAIVATYYFIRKGRFDETLKIAEMLLNHQHDLIHKATGWMLREAGNRNPDVAMNFLVKHYQDMPRTMLRYAIEKLNPQLRQQFMKGTI